MVIAQPEAFLSVMMPVTVVSLICSNDVQVRLVRVVQPPLEYTRMPAALMRESAWACDSLAAKSGSAQSGANSSPVTVPSSSSVASANATDEVNRDIANAVQVSSSFLFIAEPP